MRKLFILFFLIIFSFTLYSQNIKGGPIVGFNSSQVDGDRCYGFHRYGWHVGGTAIVPLSKNFSIHLEALYSQRGSYQKPKFVDSLNGSYSLKLNYLDVPVFVNFYDQKGKMNFGAGLLWGKLVEFSEMQDGYVQNYSKDKIPYKNYDVDYFFNFYVALYKGLKLDFRYSYSLLKIRTRYFVSNNGQPMVMNQFNNYISISLMYIFKDQSKIEKNEIH